MTMVIYLPTIYVSPTSLAIAAAYYAIILFPPCPVKDSIQKAYNFILCDDIYMYAVREENFN